MIENSTLFFSNPIKLFGGFDGTELGVDDRNLLLNQTILNGDIGISQDSSDNARHVLLTAAGIDTTYLDGFTIQNGNANGTSFLDDMGGGLLNLGIFYGRNLIFESNYATSPGAVISSIFPGAKLILEDCEIRIGNTVTPIPILNSIGSEMTIKNSVVIPE